MQRRERTDEELEWLFLLGVCVAGKQAYIIQEKMKVFANGRTDLFAYIRELRAAGRFEARLREVKMGKYRIIQACFEGLFERDLDLRKCTLADLEALPGIGPKTSRFFVGYSRPGQRVAILDVHILRFLAEQGVENVPRQTPQSAKRYAELEEEYLKIADRLEVDPTQLDDVLWKDRAKGDWT